VPAPAYSTRSIPSESIANARSVGVDSHSCRAWRPLSVIVYVVRVRLPCELASAVAMPDDVSFLNSP